QMVWRLRTDPRVHLLERKNARYLTLEEIGERADLLTLDVSFISATLLLPVLAPAAEIAVLVKPQFEAGRKAVAKGGIVRDEAARAAAVSRVEASLAH